MEQDPQVQSKYELRDQIDELSNQSFHLERSNEELKDALLEEPEEEEFTLAISENETIIKNKRNKVFDLKVLLCSIDAAYFKEHYNDELVENLHRREMIPSDNNSDAMQPVAVAIAVAVEENEISRENTTEGSTTATETIEVSSGLYL